MLDERQIIDGCCRKDRKAQKALFDRYGAVLLGVCIRYSNRRDEAEDILQEGFVKIYSNIRDYAGTGSFINWMKKIMINTSITHYHRNLKHAWHKDIDQVQETDIEGRGYDEADFTKEELLNIIHDLPDGYRMVFNLYAIEGFKHKEIASMLDIDINTSKSQYSRARGLIRRKLYILKKWPEPSDDEE
ncbi:MAG: RNA polymerase sigma factor [Acidobacteria bacterium]|nr:RNA polymerase sigma factor [Acidobacteriota bacterium]